MWTVIHLENDLFWKMSSMLAPSLPQREPCCKMSGQCTSLSIARLSVHNLLPNAHFQGNNLFDNLLSNPSGLPALQVVVGTNDRCITLSGFSSFALFMQFSSKGLPRRKSCTSTQKSTEIKPEIRREIRNHSKLCYYWAHSLYDSGHPQKSGNLVRN
jgi:hypothetical protein